MPVIDFVLQRLEARHDLTTAQGKSAAADEIADVLAGIASPIQQDHYTNEVATRLKVDVGAVRRLLRGKQRHSASPRERSASQPTDVRGDTNDDYLLALLMRLRDVPGTPAVEGPMDFVLPESRELYRNLGADVPAHLEPYAQRARRWLVEAARLSTDRLLEDIARTRLEIRKKKLEAERSHVHALLGEGALELDEANRLLDQYRQQMEDVARQLQPERERAGTR
jgi:DNA primase